MAKAKVVFKSAVPPRKYGINNFSPLCSAICPIEPTPGIIPNQLLIKIKKKKVKTRGANCKDFFRDPVTLSKIPKKPSIIISIAFWIPVGTRLIFFLIKIVKKIIISKPKPEVISELVIAKEPTWVIGSAYKVFS